MKKFYFFSFFAAALYVHAAQTPAPQALEYRSECAPSKMGLPQHRFENTENETIDEASIRNEIVKVRREKDKNAETPILANSLVDLARTLSAAACARYADPSHLMTTPLRFTKDWSEDHQACFNILDPDSKNRNYTLHSVSMVAIPPYSTSTAQDIYSRRMGRGTVSDANRIPLGKMMVRGYPEGNDFQHHLAMFSLSDKNKVSINDRAILQWSNREIFSPFAYGKATPADEPYHKDQSLLYEARFLGVGCTPCDIRNFWEAQSKGEFILGTSDHAARMERIKLKNGKRLFLRPLELEEWQNLLHKTGGSSIFLPYPEVIYCSIVGRLSEK